MTSVDIWKSVLERPGGKNNCACFSQMTNLNRNVMEENKEADNRGKNGREEQWGDEGAQGPSTAKALVATPF